MGGGGSAQGANDSLRFNRWQLGKRPNMFKKERRYFEIKRKYKNQAGGIEVLKKLSEQEKEKIRNDIRRKARKEKNFVLFTTFIFIICFILGLFFIITSSTSQFENNKKSLVIKEKENNFLIFLKYGDTWIEEEKWDAAIYNFEKALKLYPNSFEAKYRLVLAYSYKCERMKFDCEVGEELISQLILDYPNKHQLLKLEFIFKTNQEAPIIVGD
ncbi:MAG: hypothetical protein QM499_06980 [Flavobacteriaceae bacterium]